MYLIKHKATNQYLEKWFARDRFGHWSDKPKMFNKKTRDQVKDAIGDFVEVTYKKKTR
jgi:hypothetical protein